MFLENSDSLEFLLVQVIRLYHHSTHKLLNDWGIHTGQPPVLFLLWRQDGRSQKEFAELLGIKPATVTVTLKRMEKSGWLERRPDESDGRVTRVFLTEKAKSIKPKVEAAFSTVNSQCFKGFTAEEKVLLRRFLLHMKDNLAVKVNQE